MSRSARAVSLIASSPPAKSVAVQALNNLRLEDIFFTPSPSVPVAQALGGNERPSDMTQESTDQLHRQPHQRRLLLLSTDKRIYHVTSACPQNSPSPMLHGIAAKSLWQQILMPPLTLALLQLSVYNC
jgi:hypothetical protein